MKCLFCILASVGCVAFAQSRLSFDVVSIRPAATGEPREAFESLCAGGGRYISRQAPLLWEIKWAYGINDYQMDPHWPAWLNAHGTYDIEAVAERPVDETQCRRMVQALFEDRFKLKMHSETKTQTAYALVIARNGPRLGSSGNVKINGAIKQSADEREAPKGWTMARLANYLASIRTISRPVVDRTGLAGNYGFTLDYSVADNDDRLDVFRALQSQLGLKLETVKAPIEMFVVDHVEKPSGN